MTTKISASLFLMGCLYVAAGDMPAWKKAFVPEGKEWKKTKQHLAFNNGAEPETLDPALMTGSPEILLARALFEGLTTPNPVTLKPEPGLAERWEISSDGLIYTFRLRSGLKWSDGQPLKAVDILQSWERVLNPVTAAQYASQLYPIKGAEDYHKKTSTHFTTVGVTAPDEVTLTVVLHSPCSYFLDLASFPTLFPVPLSVVKEKGDRWIRPENMVSNGPYRLESWVPRQKLVLVKNPHYWDHDFCKLERVTALPYDNIDTAYKLYQQGEIHWMPAIPLPKLDEIKRNPDYYVTPFLGIYFYRFNVTQEPFNDKRVRQALSIAVDRDVITRQILRGGQRPATFFCPPVAGYTPVKGLDYDRAKARQLLKEAGFGEGGKEFPTLELFYNTSESHKQVAEGIAQQWKTNLGIKVSLRNSEWKVFLSDINKLNYQVARSSWIGDYCDPNSFFDLWMTDGGNNRTGWSHAKYDGLLAASQRELDPAKRLALFRQMEQILVEDELPVMPIYMYVNQGLLREDVMGWEENVLDTHPFQYIWLEE